MNKILMISYHYPPTMSGGVFRTLKFTKYLPTFGWQPYVLTVSNPMYDARDPTLLERISSDVRTYRTFSLEHELLLKPFWKLKVNPKWVFIPDANLGWLPFAILKGRDIIETESIDIIYATAPPFTSLLIGYIFKKIMKKPLVIDFRDPWTQNAEVIYPTSIHRRIEEILESKALHIADRVIANTEPNRNDLIEKYPFIKEKCITITNGYDPEDFKGISRKEFKNFTIAYIGSLYGGISPEGFFHALAELINEGKIRKSNISVTMAGNMSKKIISKMVQKYGLEDVVGILGYVSYKESIKLMVSSDVLLAILPPSGRAVKRWIPQKIFNYIAAKRPILGLLPEGIAADIIRSTNAGVVVPPDSVPEIKNVTYDLYLKYVNNKLGQIQPKSIEQYDRKILTKHLSDVFNDVLKC